MPILSNAHTHTKYCDGSNTPEEMVKAAIDIGFHTLGFSGHSYMPFDPEIGMSIEGTQSYIKEINALQEKYRNQIDIVLGIEAEYYSDIDLSPYQYVIGSFHYFRNRQSGVYYAVDNTLEELQACIDDIFQGNAGNIYKCYYKKVVDTAQKKPDILGHFDLIRKLNKNNCLFDESSPEYQKTALTALEACVSTGCIIEVNTGAISRGYTQTPYPSFFLLERLAQLKAPVIISSDTHSIKTIDYYFAETVELLKEAGFKTVMELGRGGFREVALP